MSTNAREPDGRLAYAILAVLAVVDISFLVGLFLGLYV